MQQDGTPTESILRLSASELAERIRERQVSVVDVVEAHIGRIEEVNPQLNAVVITLFGEARAQAAAADDALHRGEEVGPLHGVPVTIKEQYRVAGTQTTLGASKQIGNVYHDEGPLVTRLRDAGAIIVGKTNIIQTLSPTPDHPGLAELSPGSQSPTGRSHTLIITTALSPLQESPRPPQRELTNGDRAAALASARPTPATRNATTSPPIHGILGVGGWKTWKRSQASSLSALL